MRIFESFYGIHFFWQIACIRLLFLPLNFPVLSLALLPAIFFIITIINIIIIPSSSFSTLTFLLCSLSAILPSSPQTTQRCICQFCQTSVFAKPRNPRNFCFLFPHKLQFVRRRSFCPRLNSSGGSNLQKVVEPGQTNCLQPPMSCFRLRVSSGNHKVAKTPKSRELFSYNPMMEGYNSSDL